MSKYSEWVEILSCLYIVLSSSFVKGIVEASSSLGLLNDWLADFFVSFYICHFVCSYAKISVSVQFSREEF